MDQLFVDMNPMTRSRHRKQHVSASFVWVSFRFLPPCPLSLPVHVGAVMLRNTVAAEGDIQVGGDNQANSSLDPGEFVESTP